MDAETELAPAIIVTATGPGHGRLLTLAALAAGLSDEGVGVHVVTVVRTEPGLENLLRVGDLFDVPTLDLVRLTPQAPPVAAAREEGVNLPSLTTHASRVALVARDPGIDFVLLDDPEGLCVPLDDDGSTLLDLAGLLDALDMRVGAVVAVAPERGSVGVTTMTCEVLRDAGVDVLGLVGAGWPDAPTEVTTMLSDYLPSATGHPWLGNVPAAAAVWSREDFTARAATWLPIR